MICLSFPIYGGIVFVLYYKGTDYVWYCARRERFMSVCTVAMTCLFLYAKFNHLFPLNCITLQQSKHYFSDQLQINKYIIIV